MGLDYDDDDDGRKKQHDGARHIPSVRASRRKTVQYRALASPSAAAAVAAKKYEESVQHCAIESVGPCAAVAGAPELQ